MVGDLAAALQIASHQRRSFGEDNFEVTGLVQEAVSEWLEREIDRPLPASDLLQDDGSKQATPVSESAQPGETPRRSKLRGLAMVLALIAALLGLTGWSLVESREQTTSAQTESISLPVMTAPAPAAPGLLTIDVQPWAEVSRVVDASGAEMTLPEDRYTPLRIGLPPGRYYVKLTRPDSGKALYCSARVASSTWVRCMPRNADADVKGFFRSTGWWR